jgi:hypothetical protein
MDVSQAFGPGSVYPGYVAEDDYQLTGRFWSHGFVWKWCAPPWERTYTRKAW